MKKYIIKLILFVAIGILLGEITVRVFNLTVDIPKCYQDKDMLFKYEPNQSGMSFQRQKWIINKYGNFGFEPPSLDSLITIIGNSYISNTMNPPECHQSVFLAKMNKDYNFYPMSRDGASFIEYMEMAKSLERLNPILQLLYVQDEDFTLSLSEEMYDPNTIQLSLENNKLRYVQSSPEWIRKGKWMFQNLKFVYFLYRNIYVEADRNPPHETNSKYKVPDRTYLQLLFNYVKENYATEHIVLIFFPGSNQELIDLTDSYGFKTFLLEADDYVSWLTSVGGHWSCIGHEEAARQVNSYLSRSLKL